MTSVFSISGKRIWIAGHRGMVGQALIRRLENENCEILTVNKDDLDLRDQAKTQSWIKANMPDAIIIAAAKVGGIGANANSPATFFYDNIMIETNILHSAYEAGVSKVLFLGSSCIYPKFSRQPITEDALLTGALEPTNEAYAIAKIAGLKMAQFYRTQYGCDFISAMPCNLYGLGDTYDAYNSHVIPSMILKMHKAKTEGTPSVTLWGSGTALREFMDVDDLADGLVFLLSNYSNYAPVNIGTGQEHSIKEVAEIIRETTGFKGNITFDTSMPDGTPRKVMDISFLTSLGWESKLCLNYGTKKAYKDYLGRYENDFGKRNYASDNGRRSCIAV